jgi:hypothetical protein
MGELSSKQKSAVARAVANPELLWILLSKARGAVWVPAFRDAGWLDPQKFPGPTPVDSKGFYSIPAWPISHFLAENSEDFSLEANEAMASSVYDFVVASSLHAKLSSLHNYRVWWNFAKVLRGLPVHLLRDEDLWIIDYWLSDPHDRGLVGEEIARWIAGLLHERSGPRDRHIAAVALASVFSLRVDFGSKEVHLTVSEWHAEKIAQRLVEVAVQNLGLNFVNLLESRLAESLAVCENDSRSFVWRPAIEDHEQNRSAESAQSILTSLLRDSIALLCRHDVEASLEFVRRLASSNLQVFRRIALHSIRVEYQRFSSLLSDVLQATYFVDDYRHELWWLLHDHFDAMLDVDRDRVMRLITEVEGAVDNGDTTGAAAAYRRAIWLSAIKEHPAARALYEDAVALCGVEPDHPDFPYYMSAGWVAHRSPIEVDELKALTLDALVERLNGFQVPERRSFDEPDIEGLAKAVRALVKSSPVSYASGLRGLSSLKTSFAYEVLEAYAELWRDTAPLPWETIWPEILDFCVGVVSVESYWSEDNKESREGFVATRYWFNGAIGRAISAAVQDEKRAMPSSCLERALHLLEFVLAREEGDDEFGGERDPVSIAINSPRGNCVRALIHLCIHECRLEDRVIGSHVEAWNKFSPKFDREMAREGEFEFVTLMVCDLSSFLYMSSDWLMCSLPRVFDQSNTVRWSCAMHAYHYVTRVYQPIYSFLRDGGHFAAALDASWSSDRVLERVVENICIAYLQGHEQLSEDGSMISLLIHRKNEKELGHLIRFFWHLRDSSELEEYQRAKVVALWWAIDSTVGRGSDGASHIGKLLCWIDYLPDLRGDNLRLAISAARMLRDSQESYSYDLLRSIARRSATEPLEAAEVWFEALQGAPMSYPEESIAEALQQLVSSGSDGRRSAKRIVGAYAQRGNLGPHHMLQGVMGSAQ